ncbi:MAG: hypothetical protein ABDH32_06390 [Candidatus Caldarchaeales archaeon]
MSVEELLRIVSGLSIEEKRKLVEELLDILISSVNLENVPDDVGWRIVEAYRSGRLYDHQTIRDLGYAVSLAEPSKLAKILKESRKK